MAVHVRFFPLLARRARSRQETLDIAFQPGLRPIDIIRAEGFSDTDAEAIMVLVNDRQAELDAPVQDGDRLEFMVAMSGGAR